MKSIIRPIEFVSPLSEVEVRMTLKELCGSKWDNFPFDGEVDKNSFRLIKNQRPFVQTRGIPKPILIGDFVGQDKQTKVTISLHTRITDVIGLLVLVLGTIGGKFAYDLGVKNIITHTGFIPDDPNAEAHIGVVECLKELCAELKERGQTFSFETGEELPLTLSIMICEIGLDNVGVNFDPANLISGGRGNPCDAMELLGSRVTGFHAKDAIPAKFGEFGGKQTPIGEGKVDFEHLFRQLKELGYTGDVVIEHEMYSRPDRDGDILMSRDYLETLIKNIFETEAE